MAGRSLQRRLYVRSAYRASTTTRTTAYGVVGFRVARTYPDPLYSLTPCRRRRRAKIVAGRPSFDRLLFRNTFVLAIKTRAEPWETQCGLQSLVPVGDRPSSRVLRGGSFNNNAHNVRSAYRNNNNPDNRNNNIGFRVASTLRQTQSCGRVS